MAHMLCAMRQGARSRIEADKVHHSRGHEGRVHGSVLPVLDVALVEVPCVRLIQSPAYPPNTQADTLPEAMMCSLSRLRSSKIMLVHNASHERAAGDWHAPSS